jgi:hypothetical protein
MKIIDVPQNSPEWRKVRSGRFTASGMEQIISPTGQQSKQVEKYVNQIIAERIICDSATPFKGNANTDRGHSLEDEAADYYAMLTGTEPYRVGVCITDDEFIGCSPDRFVGEDDYLEIKTCLPHVMVEAYDRENEKEKLEQEHRPQTQCGLLVTTRKRAVTMLYCPKMTPIIVYTPRNESYIADMVKYTNEAKSLLIAKTERIKNKGYINDIR